MSVLITNIQRTSFHDGAGIRTTVFFKGCTLKCPWCANPENISHDKEFYFDNERCIAENGTCICNNSCPILKHSQNLDDSKCPVGGIGSFGKIYDEDLLYRELVKDKLYFQKTDGGITFSGGEPLLQLHKITNVLQQLKKDNIHLAVESSLYVPKDNIVSIIPYIDLFYIDIKSLENEVVSKVLKGQLDTYMRNLQFVFSQSKKIILRMPLVAEVTATIENINLLHELLKKFRPQIFEFFSVHNLAEKKYKMLNMKEPLFQQVNPIYKKMIKDICIKESITCNELILV